MDGAYGALAAMSERFRPAHACFMNLRTTRADVDLIRDELARLAKARNKP